MNSIIRLKKIIRKTIDNSILYYIIPLVAFILGTIIGALLLKILGNDTILRIINITSPYIDLEINKAIFLKNSIIFNYLFLFFIFILGLIQLGFLSTLLILARGSVLGLTVGFLIHNYGVKGFFLAVFGIYPQYIIFLPCIILAGGLSMLFDARTNLINRRKSTMKINTNDYIVFLILLIVIVTIGALYEGFLSPIIFKFQ